MEQWSYVLKPMHMGMLTEGPTQYESETVSRHFAHLQQLTEKSVMTVTSATVYFYLR